MTTRNSGIGAVGGVREEGESDEGRTGMMGRTPLWFVRLEDDIVSRMEGVVSLYPKEESRLVLWNLARAMHRRAHETDPGEAWLALALEACGVENDDLPDEGDVRTSDAADGHPSHGDAEDVAEDVSMMPTPMGSDSPRITSRTAVHVMWTRFANRLDAPDRALLAAEAAAMA